MIERGVARDNSRNIVALTDANELIKRGRFQVGRDFYQQRHIAALRIDCAQQFIETLTSLQFAQPRRIR